MSNEYKNSASENVIQFNDYSYSLKALDDSPYFDRYLIRLRMVLDDKDELDKLILWWRSNQSRVIAVDPVMQFAEFINSVELSKKTSKDLTTPPTGLTSSQQEALDDAIAAAKNLLDAAGKKEEVVGDLFGYTEFKVAFHYLTVLRGTGELELLFDKYYEVFSPEDPLKTIANTLQLFCPSAVDTDPGQPTDQEKGRGIYSKLPVVYYGSEELKFIVQLSDWVVSDCAQPNYVDVVFHGIFEGIIRNCNERELRKRIIDAALHCPYAVFLFFIKNFYFCYVDELLPFIRLPFVHKPKARDKPGLNALIIELLDCGDDPLDMNGTLDSEVKESWSSFNSKYTHYRRSYNDGASPILGWTHYELVKSIDVADIEWLPYLRNVLGADMTVIWSVCLVVEAFDEDIFFESLDGKQPDNWQEKSSRIFIALYESLIDEGQYDAAVAFLSVYIFKLSIKCEGSLEAFSDLFNLIDKTYKLPIQNTGTLDNVVQFARYNAEKNKKPITSMRLSKYTDPSNSRWQTIIKGGESATCEFKSTLRLNLHTVRKDKKIEYSVLKSIAAFMNTTGGYLFVGVSDEGVILGLESDGFKSMDALQLHFANMTQRLKGVIDGHFTPHMSAINGRQILVIECSKVKKPVYLDDNFYIRRGPSTVSLGMAETVDYVKEHFE